DLDCRASPRKRGYASIQLDSRLCGNVRKPKLRLSGVRTAAPHIDAGKQKQPHDVDEVPVPGSELKSQMLRRFELSGDGTEQADDEKDRADDHMGAVES